MATRSLHTLKTYSLRAFHLIKRILVNHLNDDITLIPYGSMITGCHSGHSDIDIMIFFDKYRYAMNKSQRINRLSKVFRICKLYVRAEKMIFLANAKHPVIRIKLKYGGMDIQIEICAHNPNPVLCTWIVKSIIDSSPNKTSVRQLIRSVTSFARHNNVLGTKGRAPAISTFSYTLLVINFLQQEGYLCIWRTVILGATDIDEDDLLQLVFDGEDDAKLEWSIEESDLEISSVSDLRQRFFEYLLNILRETHKVISIENNMNVQGEHNLLYVSHPVDLTNTVHSLSELKYNRLIEVLEDELEWTDDDDDDDYR